MKAGRKAGEGVPHMGRASGRLQGHRGWLMGQVEGEGSVFPVMKAGGEGTENHHCRPRWEVWT